MEGLEKIKEMLEKGEGLYVARVEWNSYYGSLVWGRTRHYPIRPKEPVTKIGYKRNKQLGLIEDFKGIIFMDSITTEEQSVPSISRGYTIYIAKEPFAVWVEHRGYTGDRCDDYDRIVEAKEIKSVQELLEFYE